MRIKKVLLVVSLIGCIFLSACGKKTVTDTKNDSQASVITITENKTKHLTEDPLTMDLNKLKSLCEGYVDNKFDKSLSGEELFKILSDWDEEYDKWSAFKVDSYSDKEAFYGKADGTYANAFEIGALIYYYRTGILVSLNPPKEVLPDVSSVISIETPETFEEQVIDLKKRIDEGDEEAAKTYLAYFTPTSEFVNSLTLKEFKTYFKEYCDFVGEDYSLYADLTEEQWQVAKEAMAEACDMFNE